ncbi:MAG: hypothetical protein WC122_04345 [archaeon]
MNSDCGYESGTLSCFPSAARDKQSEISDFVFWYYVDMKKVFFLPRSGKRLKDFFLRERSERLTFPFLFTQKLLFFCFKTSKTFLFLIIKEANKRTNKKFKQNKHFFFLFSKRVIRGFSLILGPKINDLDIKKLKKEP